MSKKCEGLASVQCCNFDVKDCKYRTGEDDCHNPEVVIKALEKELARYSKPLRTPNPEGVLELTETELWEVGEIVKNHGLILGLMVRDGMIETKRPSGCYEPIKDFKTIFKLTLYLAKHFNLKGE